MDSRERRMKSCDDMMVVKFMYVCVYVCMYVCMYVYTYLVREVDGLRVVLGHALQEREDSRGLRRFQPGQQLRDHGQEDPRGHPR